MQQFKAARRAAVPLVAIETADPGLTIKELCASLNGKLDETPVFQWDIVEALTGVNKCGQQRITEISDDPPAQTGNPTECLRLCRKAPEDSILFFCNAHRFITNESVMQAVWNLRDDFATKRCTLVMLTPSLTLPEELKRDVLVLREPLPDAATIEKVVDSICKDAEIDAKSLPEKPKVIRTLLGLSGFEAGQTLSVSLLNKAETMKQGTPIDMAGLWDRKCLAIEQTPGLSVHRGSERFSVVGGCQNVKDFAYSLVFGAEPINAIVFIDEIEKCIGTGSDTSGVSQDFLQCLLTRMQNKRSTGMIFVGPPGASKSHLAKAVGNEAGIPTIVFDMGGMKNSLVGSSEARIRAALDVCDAVAQGKLLFIATCNAIANLPPELKRRFSAGTFFFDLPTAEERDMIWAIKLKEFKVPKQAKPDDEGWTGAEIHQCCWLAYQLKKPLVETARFVVPVAQAAAEQIEKLRRDASNKFISAASPGKYKYEPKASAPAVGRKLERD